MEVTARCPYCSWEHEHEDTDEVDLELGAHLRVEHPERVGR